MHFPLSNSLRYPGLQKHPLSQPKGSSV
uniref:Uncharacterized protein n=1 Tax=Anopheles funestus TaxID=62324 RepID=A0A182S1V8_ANOFN